MLKRKLSPQTLAVLKYMLDNPKDQVFGLELIESLGQPAGTIYPILMRLEEIGWIQGEWESYERKDKGRRRRRYYDLTKEGKTEGKKYLKNGIKELSKLGLLAEPVKKEASKKPAGAAKPKKSPSKAAAR